MDTNINDLTLETNVNNKTTHLPSKRLNRALRRGYSCLTARVESQDSHASNLWQSSNKENSAQ